MTTDNLNFSNVEELIIDFSYIGISMDNTSEDFWLQISTNGGGSYTTVEEWNRGDEFQNNERKFDSVVIPGPFSDATRLRFRCDASGNSDWVYIDDVVINACVNDNNREFFQTETVARTAATIEDKVSLSEVKLFPNPAQENITLTFNVDSDQATNVLITDIRGTVVQQLTTADTKLKLSVNNLTPGIYIVHLVNGKQRTSKKLIVQ